MSYVAAFFFACCLGTFAVVAFSLLGFFGLGLLEWYLKRKRTR